MLSAAAFGLSACGNSASAPSPIPRSNKVPVLASAPPAKGELVFRGRVSPGSHGPFLLHGRYRVRFVQWAPEDPGHDFSGDTSFVADLAAAGPGARPSTVRLFREAAESGEKTITADGRYSLEVSFGDYPYAVRITPAT